MLKIVPTWIFRIVTRLFDTIFELVCPKKCMAYMLLHHSYKWKYVKVVPKNLEKQKRISIG